MCNKNCLLGVYNRDLQTTIILFTCNGSSHNTDWILSESPLLALYCLLYRIKASEQSNECLCLCEIFINLNKLLAVLLLPVYFLSSSFILMLLLYFCLFVGYISKPIIFVFGAFIYNFYNTISIFVTIFYINCRLLHLIDLTNHPRILNLHK